MEDKFMIHDEICTYEVAKLAKENGFNEYVEAFYAEDCNTAHTQGSEKWNEYKGKYAAPTQSLLQRWLREEKNIDIAIVPLYAGGYSYIVYNIHCRDNRVVNANAGYDTYELALEDAIAYSLENLV